MVRTLDCPAAPNPAWDAERPECATSSAPYRVYNIGNNQPVNLLDFVATLEEIIGKPAIRDLLPMQAGDVLETLCRYLGDAARCRLLASTPLAEGLRRFVEWYRSYHGVAG